MASPVDGKEKIISDDSSNDNMRTVLEKEIKSLTSKIIYHYYNQGKEVALEENCYLHDMN